MSAVAEAGRWFKCLACCWVLSFVQRQLKAEVCAVSLCLSEAAELPAVPAGPGELLAHPQEAPLAGEPSTAECSVCAPTLLGVGTLSWHRHTELIGNQFIHLNMQPSLSSVYLVKKHYIFYNILPSSFLWYLALPAANWSWGTTDTFPFIPKFLFT